MSFVVSALPAAQFHVRITRFLKALGAGDEGVLAVAAAVRRIIDRPAFTESILAQINIFEADQASIFGFP